MIPYAHIGHYLWVFYLIPVLIVVAAILRSSVSERNPARTPEADAKSDSIDGASAISAENPKPEDAPPGG